MMPLTEGYRSHALMSTYGGVAQRWMLVASEHRRPQAQRTVDKPWLTQSEADLHAFRTLCHTPVACEADAQQALGRFTHGLQATALQEVTIRATPHDGTRGRPRPGTEPIKVVYPIEGARASSLAAHQARVIPQSCCILATNELDATQLSPQAFLEGYKGQQHAERGFRFVKDPRFLASSLSRKKPERIMALLMVMTVCLLVYAA